MIKILKSEKLRRKVAKITYNICMKLPSKIAWNFFIYRYKHGLLIDDEVVIPGVDDEVLDDGLDWDYDGQTYYSKEYDDLHYDGNWNYIG